jgi:hypothetical protein
MIMSGIYMVLPDDIDELKISSWWCHKSIRDGLMTWSNRRVMAVIEIFFAYGRSKWYQPAVNELFRQ